MRHNDKVSSAREAMKMALGVNQLDKFHPLKGTYILHLEDLSTGEVLHHIESQTEVDTGCGHV